MNSRTRILIGENFNNINGKHVAIFGIGGVGGYVAEMLVRSGLPEITLVDFDSVTLSNINRQIIALNSTVGLNKVDAMQSRLLDINKDLIIHKICKCYSADIADEFFVENYDYVADCIDMVASKVSLIVECHNRNIPIISAMGAGNRHGIPNFEVVDIYKTSNDGLAKVLRKKLRDLGLIGTQVVYTNTKSNKIDCEENTIGSIVYYPAMCGCVISAKILEDLYGNN